MVVLAAILTVCNYWYGTTSRSHWYIYREETRSAEWISLLSFFSFMLLLNSVISLDLIASVELQKLLLTAYHAQDAELISPENGNSIITHTLNLWEELGEVNYMFCDKTGTLTQNKLTFKHHFALKHAEQDLWRCLNLCHTCSKIGDEIHGPSLDEVCLLAHSATTESYFKEKNSREITINQDG